MRAHLLVNQYRPDALEAARQVVAVLQAHHVDIAAERDSAIVLGVPALAGDDLANCDLMVTFGGDGTLLRASHICAERGTPILGVYFGRFGFVTQCMPEEMGAAISQFLDGQAVIEERMMVQTELIRNERVVATLHSLNESAVQRSATTRILTFEVKVNGRLLSRYPADGVMVATPTGSTAYNLSAGGPVIDPKLETMLITAIMPHTLAARPLAVRPEATIDIAIESQGDAVLSCDGQSRLHLLTGDMIRITKSPRVTRLVYVDDEDFFEKLSDRFEWSKGSRTTDGPHRP
ncbi:MAG: NAD(+)/NADH kinase [Armatimonadota bacterium]